MKASASFKEFRHRVGLVPVRELWGCAVGGAWLFLLSYGFFLVCYLLLFLPVRWTAHELLGIPRVAIQIAIRVGVSVLAVFYIVKNRRTMVPAVVEGIAQMLRELPTWIAVLMLIYLAMAIAVFKWLPVWAAVGVLYLMTFAGVVLGEADQLGQKYELPQS